MFWIRRQKESRRCKSMSAWFPPRLGSFTTPNIASYMEFHRSADFAASVQDLSQKLGSNAFQKQMFQVEKFESLWGIFHKWSHACGCNGISPSLYQAFIHTAVPSGRQEQVYKRQSTKTQTLPSHQRTCAWCEALHPLRHTPPSRHEMFEERPTRKLVRDGAQAESEGPGWMTRRNL